MDRSRIISILAVAALMLCLATAVPANAAITSAQIVDVNGVVLDLNHDVQTQSYADGSLENPNAFVKICAGPGELINKFAGILYKVGNSIVDLEVLPAKITVVDGFNCATLDIDINFFKARYPALPVVVVGDDAAFTNPVYTELGYTDGYLLGNFTVTATEINPISYTITVTGATDEASAAIATNKPYILAGIQTPGGVVLGSAQTQLNQANVITWDGNDNDFVNINGMLFPLVPTVPAPPSGVTGAVFGVRAPFECIWTSTYDGTALPGNPIKLLYYHDCTLLREVSIEVSAPTTATRIKTYGNESMFTKPVGPSEGYAFGYFKFEHNIPETRFTNVTIQFKIPKKALIEHSNLDSISLQRLNGSTWIKLPAKFTSEDNTYYYFESVSKTLSLFAVTGEKAAGVAPVPAITLPAIKVPAFPIMPLVLALLLILIIITLGYRGYHWYVNRPITITMPKVKTPATIAKVKFRAPAQSPFRITMPAIKMPSIPSSNMTPATAQLQQRIAEIKRELEHPSRATMPQQSSFVRQEHRIVEAVRRPEIIKKPKPVKSAKPSKRAKKVNERKFYKALGSVEKALR